VWHTPGQGCEIRRAEVTDEEFKAGTPRPKQYSHHSSHRGEARGSTRPGFRLDHFFLKNNLFPPSFENTKYVIL